MKTQKIDLHWYSENIKKGLRGAVIFLPGRTNYGYNLLRQYTRIFDWTDVGLIATTPRISQGWYPPPRNAQDQDEAVSGLSESNRTIEKIITRVCDQNNLTRERIILAGFSMGAVAGVYWATQTKNPVAAMICHSGAILEPWKIPKARHEMPIILNHSADDYCFEWEERYLPMKRALFNQGYTVWLAERSEGNHFVLSSDIACCQELFETTFDTVLDWQPYWSEVA